MTDERRETLTGRRVGTYVIGPLLGAGGMGEVYRARDTKLGREVALKILPADVAQHPDRLSRFEREARALAALNHPNIAVIYGTEESDGVYALVLELVDGPTLADRLAGGPLPAADALAIAREIADALDAAHKKGIVHRDLKPANIKLTSDGRVKVLDFGLAKMAGGAVSDHTAAPTITVDATGVGTIVGTAAYMSPEQARGHVVDQRTDVWAFGCVLFEMLTGRRAFARDTMTDTLAAIIEREPAWDTVPATTPPAIVRLLHRCLDKDPNRRFRDAADVRIELDATEPATAKAAARFHWTLAAGAALLVAGVAVGIVLLRPRTVTALTEKDTILVADFTNTTADPVFDDTLRQGLSVELQQSPFLNLISDRQVQQQLALMGQSKDARLTSEVAQQICERTASVIVLEGSIASLGTQYVLGLRARHCATGNTVAQEQVQVATREAVLNSLSQVTRNIRTRVGESLATVQKHSKPLAEATTTSLEALKAYSTGMKLNLTSGNAASIPSYRRAVEIDPDFAMAYASLGLSYSTVGESVLSAKSTTKAWQLRDRVSDRERFFIDFTYERQVTGNLEKAYQTLELWLQTYPRGPSPSAAGLLGGLSTHGTGRFDRVIETARERIVTEPDSLFGYSNLASANYYLDRFDEAQAALQRATERKLAATDLLVIAYNTALLKGEVEQMGRFATLAKGKPGLEHAIAHLEALALARSGRLDAARRSSNRAMELAQQGRELETAASYRAARAVWEAVYGNVVEGKTSAMAALELSKGRDVQYAAGLALAFSGDSSRSQEVADDLEKRFPEDTFARFTYVPVLRAFAALKRGNPADSVERLNIALPYELAVNGLNFNFILGGLHSAYVRGEALVAARRYAEAAVEFQKILDHRGIVGADPIGALVHVQLGRAFARSGDTIKAKAAYQNFLMLWKDADPDIPMLKQAKTELARLQ